MILIGVCVFVVVRVFCLVFSFLRRLTYVGVKSRYVSWSLASTTCGIGNLYIIDNNNISIVIVG